MRLLLVLLLLAAPVMAGTIDLTWDAVPGATGYNVYYGNAPTTPVGSFDAGTATTYTLTTPTDCKVMYMSVTAYDALGEGPHSVEISGHPVPTVTAVLGGPYQVGVRHNGVRVNGSGFPHGSQVLIDGATVHDTRKLSCDELEIDVTFGGGPQFRDLTVLSEPANRIGVVYPDALETLTVVLVAPTGFGRVEVVP